MVHSKTAGWLASLTLILVMLPGTRAASLVFGDIDALQQENIVLTQQARAAELRQRISQANNSGGNSVATPAFSSTTALSASPASIKNRLVGIQGVKGNLEARITGDGQTWTVRKGQQWPGSTVRVSDVQLDVITLSDGSRLAPGDTYDK